MIDFQFPAKPKSHGFSLGSVLTMANLRFASLSLGVSGFQSLVWPFAKDWASSGYVIVGYEVEKGVSIGIRMARWYVCDRFKTSILVILMRTYRIEVSAIPDEKSRKKAESTIMAMTQPSSCSSSLVCILMVYTDMARTSAQKSMQ